MSEHLPRCLDVLRRIPAGEGCAGGSYSSLPLRNLKAGVFAMVLTVSSTAFASVMRQQIIIARKWGVLLDCAGDVVPYSTMIHVWQPRVVPPRGLTEQCARLDYVKVVKDIEGSYAAVSQKSGEDLLP